MNEQITIHLDNLTEEERKQFTKLLGKASEEPSKESCVVEDTWEGLEVDIDRFDIGNAFKTKEEAKIALERAQVKTELERYALEHNETLREKWDREGTYQHYSIVFDHEEKKIATTDAYFLQEESTTYFTSREIAYNAIEAVGEERILKYIFGVEVEE